MAYTTQAKVEAYLNRQLTDNEQELLNGVLAATDAWIDSQIGGSYGTVAESTRYFDGDSRILNIDPCINITEVKRVDNLEAEAHDYIDNEDFEARPRNSVLKTWLESRVGKFPTGVANIAVTAQFTLGADVPSNISQLAAYLAAQMFLNQTVGNLKSESIEGYSRTFNDYKTTNDFVQDMLGINTKDDILI
jgi:hypothetical protein